MQIQTAIKDYQVVCVITEPYPKEIIETMKAVGCKVKTERT